MCAEQRTREKAEEAVERDSDLCLAVVHSKTEVLTYCAWCWYMDAAGLYARICMGEE